MQKLSFMQAKPVLLEALRANIPVFMSGPPGSAKTALGYEVAAEIGYNLRPIHAAYLDPVDVKGMPSVDKEADVTTWVPPVFWPFADAVSKDDKTLLFFDELTNASIAVQGACYEPIHLHQVDGRKFHQNTRIIAAGNDETHKAAAGRMSTALANRFLHVEVFVDKEELTAHAMRQKWPIELIAFLRFRDELIYAFDPKSKDRAFPSARTWEYAAKLHTPNALSNAEILMNLISGVVGEGAAVEYLGYREMMNELPSIEEILLNPTGASVPKQPGALFAVTTALESRATHETFDNIIAYLDRLDVEWSVKTVKACITADPSLAKTRGFTTFFDRHASVFGLDR